MKFNNFNYKKIYDDFNKKFNEKKNKINILL